MSRNAARSRPEPLEPEPTATPKLDRRVRLTRDALGDALIELMHQKPFSEITVQNVLDRAGVSRSTFYSHYRDKNDLFLSDVEDFLQAVAFMLSRRGERSRRVAPVRELFTHMAEWHEFHGVLVLAGKFQDFLELSQGYFARAIEQRLSELPDGTALPPSRRTAVAQMFAGALVSLISWWLGCGMPGSPAEMDDAYHQMVWAGIGNPPEPIPWDRVLHSPPR
jgi:AcrR family transcriptional regulator